MDPTREEAFAALKDFFDSAIQAGVPEPYAMQAATADNQGKLSIRTMYMKPSDSGCFDFLTHAASRKAFELNANPRLAIGVFHASIKQQCNIEGKVEPLDESVFETIWKGRSRENQIGAWVSEQSAPLDDLTNLKQLYRETQQKYDFSPIPPSPRWTGYRLIPDRIEFWRFGWKQLHSRICYQCKDGTWEKLLLQP